MADVDTAWNAKRKEEGSVSCCVGPAGANTHAHVPAPHRYTHVDIDTAWNANRKEEGSVSGVGLGPAAGANTQVRPCTICQHHLPVR